MDSPPDGTLPVCVAPPAPRDPSSPMFESPVSLTVLAASLPMAAAGVAAAASPLEIEAFVLVGAMLAVFLAVAYVRAKSPGAGFYSLAFTVLATFSIGWLAPEPIMWWLAKSGADNLPRKLWAAAGLLCGLSGTTFVVTILTLIQKYLPSAVEQVVTAHLPGGGRVEVIQPVRTINVVQAIDNNGGETKQLLP